MLRSTSLVRGARIRALHAQSGVFHARIGCDIDLCTLGRRPFPSAHGASQWERALQIVENKRPLKSAEAQIATEDNGVDDKGGDGD